MKDLSFMIGKKMSKAKWMKQDALPEYIPCKTETVFIVPQYFNYFDGIRLDDDIIIHDMRLTKLGVWFCKPVDEDE